MGSIEKQADIRSSGYPIPPLPNTNLLLDMASKARSPLESSDPKRFSNQIEVDSPRAVSSPKSRLQGFKGDFEASHGALAPLPFSKNTLHGAQPSNSDMSDKENAFSSSCPRRSRKKPFRAQPTESDFGLCSRSSEEYRQACYCVQNERSDNAASWRRLLELARNQESFGQAGKQQRGDAVLRLHRRATSKFPLAKSLIDENDVFLIWLSYAEVLALAGRVRDSRNAFSVIYESGVAQRKASFFAAFANFERDNNNPHKAREILELGIKQNAQPMKVLSLTATRLFGGSTRLKSLHSPSAAFKPSATSERTGSGHRLKIGALSSDLRNQNGCSTSPKRRRIDSTKGLLTPESIIRDDQGLLPSTPENDGECTEHQAKYMRRLNVNLSQHTDANLISATIRSAQLSSPSHTVGSEQRVPSVNDHIRCHQSAVLKAEPILVSKRPPLLSKTPRLPKERLKGKAERLSADDSTGAIGFDSDDSLTEFRAKTDPKNFNYILNWSPGRSRKTCVGKASTKNESISAEDCPAAAEPSNSSATELCPEKVDQAHTARSKSSDSSTGSHHKMRYPSADAQSSLPSNANADFLPLLMENNILRVNNKPYAKLGVIGKGGSCKVYRALSKDFAVVAIKKVKLKGMDQKAIDGYANEIALLKRLQSNAAIIQMHDSEVDFHRQAIFVVMEVGEADLSHVLQHSCTVENKSSASGVMALDINFIRLTWQQMLQAVHSIHEARIIHGDLKPANFLFVRGRLKLIDFGIAKAIQSEDTTNIYRESQVGTLNYMSPEAILDSGSGQHGAPKMKCGKASDIWSLGCILYQMVYGRTPFAELHMIRKLQAIIDPNHAISFPNTANCAAAIDAIQQCLKREPRQRPPIVGENGLLNEHVFLNSGH